MFLSSISTVWKKEKDMNDNTPNEPTRPLLDDADFLRLMEAEYKNSAAPVDALEKRKIWAQLQKQIRPQPRGSGKAWLLVAALVMGLVPFIRILDDKDELGIKGQAPRPQVSLEINVLNADHSLQKLEEAESGQTLLFKVSSPTASYLALALQVDQGIPDLRFRREDALIGRDQLLGQQGQTYAYQLDHRGQSLKFCLVAAADPKELDRLLNNLPQEWSRMGADSCQTVSVK
jgi:hypothetical protein